MTACIMGQLLQLIIIMMKIGSDVYCPMDSGHLSFMAVYDACIMRWRRRLFIDIDIDIDIDIGPSTKTLVN